MKKLFSLPTIIFLAFLLYIIAVLPRSYPATSYPYELLLIFPFLQPFAIFLPIFIGLLIIITYYFILKSFKTHRQTRLIAALFLTLTPIFIFFSAVLSKHMIGWFITLLACYLSLKKKKLLAVLAFIIFLFVPFFGYTHFIAALFFIYFCSRFRSYIISLLPALFFVGFPSIPLIRDISLTSYISELGGLLGFGIFLIILLIIGIISSWADKRNYIIHYSALLLSLIVSFFDVAGLGYLVFIVSYFGALGLRSLLSMKWDLPWLRKVSVFAIVIGMLIAAFGQYSLIESLPPNENHVKSLEWLSTQPEGKILTHPSYAPWITYYSGHPTAIPDTEVFYSRNLLQTTDILSSHNVTYILIDHDMKNGLIWNEKDEGLLFLFRNNETFKKAHSNLDIDVWEFTK